MLQDQKVPDAGLEDLTLFNNILRLGITKVSIIPEQFPFPEVIGWITSKADARGMIMYNVEDKGFASFTPMFIDKSYNLPSSEVSMKTNWINSLTIDYIEVAKMTTTEVKSFQQKASGEYETSSLHTPYRLVDLMLNKIFSRDDGRFYKIGCILVMYHVTMMGTMLNWEDIIENSLSSCITAT